MSNEATSQLTKSPVSPKAHSLGADTLSVSHTTISYDLHALKFSLMVWLRDLANRSFSFGFIYIRGFFVILFIDACLTDDEPL